MSSSVGRMAGKVAMITGASPNIGGTAALAFAREGARVVCNDINAEIAEASAEAVRKAGGDAIGLAGDVTDSDAMGAIVDSAIDQYGRIDVLLNNAASFGSGGVLTMSVEQFRHQVDVILSGTFITTQHVARIMVAAGGGGSIINVLSTTGFQGPSNNLAYASAKSALLNFTRGAAMELAPHEIRVNGFAPTVTIPAEEPERTRFVAALNDMRNEDGTGCDFFRLHPWKRLPSPKDYVGALLFLASDESELMTGSVVNVDGGALARYWAEVPH
jgi:NAD(P)-dependent dehydrogenase (short-subunit alcohol dehydrogenase family)